MKQRRVYAVILEAEVSADFDRILDDMAALAATYGVRLERHPSVATWMDGRAEQVVEAMMRGVEAFG